jgi:integrase/recombinase XerD
MERVETVRVAPLGLLEGFRHDCELRGLSPETVNHYAWCMNHFLGFLDERGTTYDQVNLQTLTLYLERLRAKSARYKTVENVYAAISAFYEYLVFEGKITSNLVLAFRKRYLRRYKDGSEQMERRLLSVEEMSRLVGSIMDSRDRAIALVFAKTGIRRRELLNLDVDSIDWRDDSIKLKPTPKRSNRVVFFDEECEVALRRWLAYRERLRPKTPALFISYQSLTRLDRSSLYSAVTKYAEALGFHKPSSPRLEDHFGPHCFRHYFTTFLLRNGMPREYVKELRGDSRREAIDIYNHIDREELRKSYLACVPKLRV